MVRSQQEVSECEREPDRPRSIRAEAHKANGGSSGQARPERENAATRIHEHSHAVTQGHHVHPEEQQLEGWGGSQLQSSLGMGEGEEQRPGIRGRPPQEGRRDGKRWASRRVTHRTTRGHAMETDSAPRAGKGRVGGGHDDGRCLRERGRIGQIARGPGDFGAQRRGGRHHRRDEDVWGCGATAPTFPLDFGCDAARVLTRARRPPARARLAAWAAMKMRARLRLRVGLRRLRASPRARRVRAEERSRPLPRLGLAAAERSGRAHVTRRAEGRGRGGGVV